MLWSQDRVGSSPTWPKFNHTIRGSRTHMLPRRRSAAAQKILRILTFHDILKDKEEF